MRWMTRRAICGRLYVKAEVAAARVMERVGGVTVTAHYCRIEDKPDHWYRDFHIIVLGLDSLEVRPPTCREPRHPTHFEPSCLALNETL